MTATEVCFLTPYSEDDKSKERMRKRVTKCVTDWKLSSRFAYCLVLSSKLFLLMIYDD